VTGGKEKGREEKKKKKPKEGKKKKKEEKQILVISIHHSAGSPCVRILAFSHQCATAATDLEESKCLSAWVNVLDIAREV
jgi:hypothetical protein